MDNDKLTATEFATKYLALCEEYKAEISTNSHGVHCVYLDNGEVFPFKSIIADWDVEV